ncbi:UNVERIFIED_CONTAM: Retrovirus-related Pol polyprotein from transposon RE2 [Sesamum radiatum]|uniref:Retrovirus-related Pol polyprotein from transposon RE2 n=1 Tax=Sesamum radiatum TaxID=300843 RepID=A0AAW2S804_SESRA
MNLLFHSRDVIFHEGIFPFNHVFAQTTPTPVPLPPLYADSDDDTSPRTIPLSTTPHSIHPASLDRELPTATDVISQSSQIDPSPSSVPAYIPPPRRNLSAILKLARMQVEKGWPLWQLYVNNAFPHRHLDEEVFMKLPEGYVPAISGHVCRLKRSLYRLKQASQQWNIELTAKLQDFGYIQCPHDHCLFLKVTSTCFVGLLVYVDDILLTGNFEDETVAVKGYLHSLFAIKDLGFAKYFLSLELARSAHGLLVTQTLTNIFKDANFLEASIASTPLPPGFHIVVDAGSLLPDPGPYRQLVGRLLYLGFTRQDISFVLQQLNQFLQHTRSSHWDATVHVLRYLKGTSTLGLFFPFSHTLQPSVFTDAS